MLIETLQNIVPNKLKNILKPYFRLFFPNKNYALWWITFRCTYKCSYCPYCGLCDYSEFFPEASEKTGEEWIKALEKLPPTSFYFSGGEPFLYKDLPYIINNLPEKHSIIGIVTNASMPLSIYRKIKKKIHLNVSFHREFTSEKEFISKVTELQNFFHLTVNIVATPVNLDFLKTLDKICKSNKIALHVDPFIDFAAEKPQFSKEQLQILKKFVSPDRSIKKKKKLYNTTKRKKCSAGRNYYNIMPNGEISICSGGMDYKYSPLRSLSINEIFNLGNVFEDEIELNKRDFVCNYPCLNHCDMDFCLIRSNN